MNHDESVIDRLLLIFEQLSAAVIAYLPTLALGLGVFAFGFIVAWILKISVLRLGAGVALLYSRAAAGKSAGQVRLPWPLSVILANVAFWLTVIFFVAVTARIVGLPGVADWITGAASYLPDMAAAAAILLGGYIAASIARDFVVGIGNNQALGDGPRVFGSLVFFLLNTVAILAALRQLGIDLALVHSLIVIATAAGFGGIAFAFGMGASSSLDNIIAGYYVRRVYRLGQRVRLGGTEGEILEITPTAVVLDTPGGRALVPARRFNQEVSVLLGMEDDDDGE